MSGIKDVAGDYLSVTKAQKTKTVMSIYKAVICAMMVSITCGQGSQHRRAGLVLDRSLLDMFDAFKAANHNKNGKMRDVYKEDSEEENDHTHNANEYSMYHDGEGGHHHDDDGHNHQTFREHSHHNHPDGANHFHDGPGGHHHDDDGHNHKRHKEAKTEAEEAKVENEDLRQFTLIISKLLFQLSQM